MLKLKVCRVEDVIDDEFVEFEVDGLTVPVIIARIAGEIIAGTAMCPHEDVSLARGCVQGGTLVCSAHGYAFDLGTGVATHDSTLVWRRYRTTVLGGDVFVDLA